jgi:hypothetical protein
MDIHVVAPQALAGSSKDLSAPVLAHSMPHAAQIQKYQEIPFCQTRRDFRIFQSKNR